MIGSEAVALVQNRLGSRTGLELRILGEMAYLQSTVLERSGVLPWFLLDELTASTVAEQDYVDVPAGFLREYDEGGLWLQDADGAWQPLKKNDYYALKEDSTLASASGQSQYYALVGAKLYLFPTPDSVYPLSGFAYFADAPPDMSSENLWLLNAPDMLITHAGLAVARHLRDQEAALAFKQDADAARLRMVVEGTARAEAAYERYMGG